MAWQARMHLSAGGLFNLGDNIIIDVGGRIEIISAMHHAMADCIDLIKRGDTRTFAVDERFENDAQGFLMVFHVLLEDAFFFISAVLDVGILAPYPFA